MELKKINNNNKIKMKKKKKKKMDKTVKKNRNCLKNWKIKTKNYWKIRMEIIQIVIMNKKKISNKIKDILDVKFQF